MEIYALDEFQSRIQIIDEFESFIWTERYSDLGEFKIVVKDTAKNRGIFRDVRYLTHSLTDRMMVVENRLRKIDANGLQLIDVGGPSFEAILKSRVVNPSAEGKKTWDSKGTLGWLATRLVGSHMVEGPYDPYDIIAGMYIADTTGETKEVDAAVEMGSIYDGVKKLCDSGKLGFRIQLLPTDPRLRFNVYKGRDLRHVVFSSTLDTLTEESHLHDISNHKNIARVRGKNGRVITVPAPGTSVYRTGWMRKVLDVNAEDVDPEKITTTVYDNMLRQRGLEALGQANKIDIFDAKLTGVDPYDYRYSYSLGDIVTMMDAENRRHTAVITEYIWSWDSNGLRAYPTFVATDEWN